MRVVYVDSGSTDGSVQLARSHRAEVVELDMSRPFSAARARNEGYDRLRRSCPEVRYVQFVDGDCALADGWLEAAERFLDDHPEYAAVCGRRRERYPEKSIYNRLCDMEWDTPVGDAHACGGDAMFRVSAFEQVGGFNPDVPAGEEPELCERLRQGGWKVRRLEHEMTVHDAAMTRFGQWWKRSVRTGHGSLDVASRFQLPVFKKIVRSARVWALVFPGLVVTLAIVLGILHGIASGVGVVAVGFLAALLQVLRIAMRAKGTLGWRDAVLHGWLSLIAKCAEVAGQSLYLWRNLRGKPQQLLEYKASPSLADTQG